MIINIYFSCLVFCFLGAYFGRKLFFLKYIVFAMIAYLMGRAAITPDTVNYYKRYLNAQDLGFNETYEPGYLFVQKLAIFIGLDFVAFQIVFVFVSFVLINSFVKRISSETIYYFCVFYLCFFVFIDSAQIRSFYGFSFVLAGLGYLIKPDGKAKKTIYFLFVIMACTIHISMLIFMPFIFLGFKNKQLIKQIIKLIVFFTLFGCIYIYLQGNSLGAIKLLMSMATGDSDRMGQYGETSVRLGFLYPFLVHFISLSIIGVLKYSSVRFHYSTRTCQIIDFTMAINLISLLYLPFYMFNLQFFRMARSIMLIDIVLFSYLIASAKINRLRWLYSFLGVILLSTYLFYYTFIISDHIEDTFMPFFDEQNVVDKYNYW